VREERALVDFDSIGQGRPALTGEGEARALAPADLPETPDDLDKMALQLVQMHRDAAVAAEGFSPGLNSFFAFVLGTGLAYVAIYVAQSLMGMVVPIAHGRDYLNVPRVLGAVVIGFVIALATGIRLTVLARRAPQVPQDDERELVSR
jgi:hypothetical protein